MRDCELEVSLGIRLGYKSCSLLAYLSLRRVYICQPMRETTHQSLNLRPIPFLDTMHELNTSAVKNWRYSFLE